MSQIWAKVMVCEGDTDAEFDLPELTGFVPRLVALEVSGKYTNFVEVFKRGSLGFRDHIDRLCFETPLEKTPNCAGEWRKVKNAQQMRGAFSVKVHFVPALPPMEPVELQLMLSDGKKEP
jgi:hypothetical protein